MRVFKTKAFERFARKERITDRQLSDAIRRAQQGLLDADLGRGVIKQRVARPGEGRSGGYRALIAFRIEHRAVFIFGFAKKDQANIDDDELRALRKAAAEILSWSDAQISVLVKEGKWLEIDHDA